MKTLKGTVAIEKNDNRIRLRWSCESKRYCLSLGFSYTDVNLKVAEQKARQIELDILSGNFDPTLNKYRIKQVAVIASPEVVKPSQELLLPIWDKWVISLCLPTRTLCSHYARIRRYIEKADPLASDAFWYEAIVSLSPRIWNDSLSYLVSCLNWAISEKLVSYNPFSKLKRRKVLKNQVKPFNHEEVKAIVNAFRNNLYCPKSSAYKHSFYADYIEFLFLTGVRPSEAIGLQRQHVDFTRNEIVICSVLARGDQGQTASKHRVRKETKTGSIRFLTMTARLTEMLAIRCRDLKSDDLVFTSPNGNAIDDNNFTTRQWKVVLAGLGIEYRKVYTTRHTLASMALEANMPITSVAYLLGHSDTTMIMQTYGHVINRPSLPDFS